MSVALDYYADTARRGCGPSTAPVLVPVEDTPVRPGDRSPARSGDRTAPHAPARALAGVSVLHAPRGREVARPLRLTRRGVAVLSVLVAALGGALVWTASLSAAGAPAPTPMPAFVTVHSGDTLWSIASRFSGNGDPGAVVDRIERRNHLTDARLAPGQVLRLR